jgi:magnesium transporter
MDAVDQMRTRVLEIQDQMEQAPEETDVAELQELGSANRTLDAVIGERIVVLDRLRLTPSSALDLEPNRDFQLAVSDAGYVDRVTDRIEKRLNNLRAEYSLHQQERTNRRLAVLTVLSAIFLPLTLLAGIYGMNFQNMPELGHRYGYPIALGSMALVAVGMVAWFRWKGWFD